MSGEICTVCGGHGFLDQAAECDTCEGTGIITARGVVEPERCHDEASAQPTAGPGTAPAVPLVTEDAAGDAPSTDAAAVSQDRAPAPQLDIERIQMEDLRDSIGAQWDGTRGWLLPFYGVTSAGNEVAELLPVGEWIEQRRAAARRLSGAATAAEPAIERAYEAVLAYAVAMRKGLEGEFSVAEADAAAERLLNVIGDEMRGLARA